MTYRILLLLACAFLGISCEIEADPAEVSAIVLEESTDSNALTLDYISYGTHDNSADERLLSISLFNTNGDVMVLGFQNTTDFPVGNFAVRKLDSDESYLSAADSYIKINGELIGTPNHGALSILHVSDNTYTFNFSLTIDGVTYEGSTTGDIGHGTIVS